MLGGNFVLGAPNPLNTKVVKLSLRLIIHG